MKIFVSVSQNYKLIALNNCNDGSCQWVQDHSSQDYLQPRNVQTFLNMLEAWISCCHLGIFPVANTIDIWETRSNFDRHVFPVPRSEILFPPAGLKYFFSCSRYQQVSTGSDGKYIKYTITLYRWILWENLTWPSLNCATCRFSGDTKDTIVAQEWNISIWSFTTYIPSS